MIVMLKKDNRKFVKSTFLYLCILTMLTILAACSSTSQSGGDEGSESEASLKEEEIIAVKQVTNWFAEPEHGGQYAAFIKDFYKEAGMDMTIEPGGPQVSAVQIVSSGSAMFGMAQADDILMARNQGIPIVAIAATFQTNPQGLIFHKEQGIQDFPDLNGRTVYTMPGASYWEYMKKKYNLEVQDMAYTGSLVNFISDPEAVTQGYITAEPFALTEQGIENDILLNAESGYNPYANVLFTMEETIEKQPELVKAFVEASIKGWDYYKENSDEINEYINELNPDISLEAMKYGAKAQMDLVYGGDAETNGVGYLTEERWKTLLDQMVDIEMIEADLDVSKAFTNEFLPKN